MSPAPLSKAELDLAGTASRALAARIQGGLPLELRFTDDGGVLSKRAGQSRRAVLHELAAYDQELGI